MGSVVIPFAEARARFAGRVAERDQRNREQFAVAERKRGEFAESERRRLMADLATWPEPFRRRLCERVECRCSVDRIYDPWTREECRGASVLDHLRGNPDASDGWKEKFHSRLLDETRWLRELAAKKPKAKAAKERRREQIRLAQASLLETLWLYGYRKLDRRRLRRWARRRVQIQRACALGRIGTRRAEIEDTRDRLRRNVYDLGVKAGQPFAESFRQQLRRKIERLKAEIGEEFQRIAAVDRESDPLRAWGLYAPRLAARFSRARW